MPDSPENAGEAAVREVERFLKQPKKEKSRIVAADLLAAVTRVRVEQISQHLPDVAARVARAGYLAAGKVSDIASAAYRDAEAYSAKHPFQRSIAGGAVGTAIAIGLFKLRKR